MYVIALKVHSHVRLRLKIATAGWHVMLGQQVAGKTDHPCQAAGAIFSLNLTCKCSFKPRPSLVGLLRLGGREAKSAIDGTIRRE